MSTFSIIGLSLVAFFVLGCAGRYLYELGYVTGWRNAQGIE